MCPETKVRYVFLDDRTVNRSMFSPVCEKCKHLKDPDKQTCDAFPDLSSPDGIYDTEELPPIIPDEIWEGKNDHKKPYPGDHGIQFEPK